MPKNSDFQAYWERQKKAMDDILVWMLDDMWDDLINQDCIYPRITLKPRGTSVLLIIGCELKGVKQVAFIQGDSTITAFQNLRRRVRDESMPWKLDKYAKEVDK